MPTPGIMLLRCWSAEIMLNHKSTSIAIVWSHAILGFFDTSTSIEHITEHSNLETCLWLSFGKTTCSDLPKKSTGEKADHMQHAFLFVGSRDQTKWKCLQISTNGPFKRQAKHACSLHKWPEFSSTRICEWYETLKNQFTIKLRKSKCAGGNYYR